MLDSIAYEPDPGIVRIRMSGSFSVEDYGCVIERLWRDAVPPTVQLWDMREVDYSEITLATMREVKVVRDSIVPAGSRSASAVVVNVRAEELVVRLFVAFDADHRRALEVFTRIREAEAWCRARVPEFG